MAQAAASIGAQQRMPIIDLSGHAALLDGAKAPPPVFTLAKPVSGATLQETLRRALAVWLDVPRP
jgi:hypothetical protein